MAAILDLQQRETSTTHQADADDTTAELIASLSEHEADLLWAALIQLKPSLRD